MKTWLRKIMTAFEILQEALRFYEIKILSVEGTHVKIQNKFEIETEAGDLYKLYDDGFVVGPFNDVNELCRFILVNGQ